MSTSESFSKAVVVDEEKRFSQSKLWELQASAYSQYGQSAWSHKGVPFYVTSNPYTAKRYAQVVLGYIRDLLSGVAGPFQEEEPLYILDLGAGAGRFAYLFLHYLRKFLGDLRLERIKTCLVMTDMVESNLNFLKTHKQLQPYIEEGLCDFALFHLETQKEELHLLHSSKVIAQDHLVNPLVVIGNYFFDTVYQDLFRVSNGELFEGRVKLSTKEVQGVSGLDPSVINHLDCEYTYHLVEKPEDYYPEFPALNQLLQSYRNTFSQASFLFPTGAFETIRYFERLSNGRFLLLCGDQGVCTEEQVEAWGEPKISKHASFSFPVSYHALQAYFRQEGGEGFLANLPETDFVVLAAMKGGEQFPETQFAYSLWIDSFEPQNYWNLINFEEKFIDETGLDHILLLLKLGDWDFCNFHAFFEIIRKRLRMEASHEMHLKVADALHRVWEHFYCVTEAEALLVVNMGVLFFDMKFYRDAILFFERSLEIMPKNAEAYFNMGLCYASLQDEKKAQEFYEAAVTLDPNLAVKKIK